MHIINGVYSIFGESDILVEKCHDFIKILSEKNHIKEKPKNILWCSPSKGLYKKSDLESARNMLSLHHTANSPAFLILQDAHKLPDILATSFLKILEELPECCYVFICAPAACFLLPTISSRCICIAELQTPKKYHPLIEALFSKETSPPQFEELVIHYSLDERSIELLVAIITSELLHSNGGNAKVITAIDSLLALTQKRIFIGNTLLFWRALFALLHVTIFRRT